MAEFYLFHESGEGLGFPDESPIVNVYRFSGEALGLVDLATVRVSHFSGEALGIAEEPGGAGAPLRVSRLSGEALGIASSQVSNGLRVTWLSGEAVALVELPGEPEEPETAPGFFYDEKHDAWWTDEVPFVKRPTALAIFDADAPDDRVVAVGCDDGYLRVLHRDAETDDGTAIESELLIGPFTSGLPDFEVRMGQLQSVLARDKSGCTFSWYVSEEPDAEIDDLTPVAMGTLPAGLSDTNYERARGLYVWLLIQGTTAGPWALEALSVVAAQGGRARTRTS